MTRWTRVASARTAWVVLLAVAGCDAPRQVIQGLCVRSAALHFTQHEAKQEESVEELLERLHGTRTDMTRADVSSCPEDFKTAYAENIAATEAFEVVLKRTKRVTAKGTPILELLGGVVANIAEGPSAMNDYKRSLEKLRETTQRHWPPPFMQ